MGRFFAFGLLIATILSCTPTEKLKYTINTSDSRDEYFNDRTEKTIQPYDYLYIKIYSLDDKTNSMFGNDQYGQSSESMISYEVNDKGYINFPFIGEIQLSDLTVQEAKYKLEEILNSTLTNVSVRVRFVGNKITVLGEVRSPGNYTFFDEKITVFQALGLAGDIADYGDKTNVTLVREKNDQINYNYLDLTDKRIVTSDYYYLLPNDIIIIQPVKAKYRTLQDRYLITIIFTGVTSLATLILAINTFNF